MRNDRIYAKAYEVIKLTNKPRQSH